MNTLAPIRSLNFAIPADDHRAQLALIPGAGYIIHRQHDDSDEVYEAEFIKSVHDDPLQPDQDAWDKNRVPCWVSSHGNREYLLFRGSEGIYYLCIPQASIGWIYGDKISPSIHLTFRIVHELGLDWQKPFVVRAAQAIHLL